jgi:hypothetical protein
MGLISEGRRYNPPHMLPAVTLGSFSDVPTWRRPKRKCGAMGVKVEKPKVAPHGMQQLYVIDPDGYVLCFQWRLDQTST